MIEAAEIGNRHMRAVAGLGDGAGMAVQILAGPLARQADQQLLACLINLLCRMAGTVSAIALAVPEVVLTVPLPNGAEPGPAFDRLHDLARWAVGDAVPVVATVDEENIYTISLDPSAPSDMVDLYVTGTGWTAWIGTTAPEGASTTDAPNPIGPWFAACLAAGEVFKQARGITRGRVASDEGYALWDGTIGPFAALHDGPPLEGCTLPPYYLIGAGAVGQGLIALHGASKMPGFVVTVDDDVHDGTNLNRCAVAGAGDVGDPKIDAITRYRAFTGLAGIEFRGTLQQFQQHGPLAEMPAGLRAKQADDQFDLVVSAVDKNTSRWDLQGLAPKSIIGGSTDQLTAKAMTYGGRADRPCLACHNPREEDGERRRLLEQQIRGLDEAAGRTLLSTLGVANDEADAVLAYVREAPACGSFGDQVLRSLAATPSEFSVSFVSMAAAVLAFVRLVQVGCFEGAASTRTVMSSIAFRNLSYADDGLARDATCPFCQRAPAAY